MNTVAGIGDNSGVERVAAAELRSFCERVERLQEEKKTIAEDIREVFGEAKGRGYDTKVLRAVIKRRAQDKAEREEFEAVFDMYLSALGED